MATKTIFEKKDENKKKIASIEEAMEFVQQLSRRQEFFSAYANF